MAQLRNALRAYAFEAHPPAAALEHLNRLAWTLEHSVMATLVYLRVRSRARGRRAPRQRRPSAAAAGEAGRVHPVPGGGTIAPARSPARDVLPRGRVRCSSPARRCCSTRTGWSSSAAASIDDGLRTPCSSRVSAGHDGLEDALRPAARDARSERRGRRRAARARAGRSSRRSGCSSRCRPSPWRCARSAARFGAGSSSATRATKRATRSSWPATRRSRTRSSTRTARRTARSRSMPRSRTTGSRSRSATSAAGGSHEATTAGAA